MGTSINTSISLSIPFSRRVINDIEEHQKRALDDSVEGTTRGTNTSPVPGQEEQEEEVITQIQDYRPESYQQKHKKKLCYQSL